MVEDLKGRYRNGQNELMNEYDMKANMKKTKVMKIMGGDQGGWGNGPPKNLRWGRPMDPYPQYLEG